MYIYSAISTIQNASHTLHVPAVVLLLIVDRAPTLEGAAVAAPRFSWVDVGGSMAGLVVTLRITAAEVCLRIVPCICDFVDGFEDAERSHFGTFILGCFFCLE